MLTVLALERSYISITMRQLGHGRSEVSLIYSLQCDRGGEGKGRKNGLAKLARLLKSPEMLMTWGENFALIAK